MEQVYKRGENVGKVCIMKYMRENHGEILENITAEYPTEVEGMKQYEKFKPVISKKELQVLCEGDEGLTELFDDMIEYFYRYTADVCAQESLKHEKDGIQKNMEEIRALEAPRGALHDAMIDSVKILVRNLVKKGKDVSWYQNIDKGGRIGYANLALLITFADILERNQSQESL